MSFVPRVPHAGAVGGGDGIDARAGIRVSAAPRSRSAFLPPLCPRGVGSALHVNAIFPTTTLALHIRAPRSHS